MFHQRIRMETNFPVPITFIIVGNPFEPPVDQRTAGVQLPLEVLAVPIQPSGVQVGAADHELVIQ